MSKLQKMYVKRILFIAVTLLFITTSLTAQDDVIWARGAGSNLADFGQSVTTDLDENIIITGYFQGTVDFDTGDDILNITSIGDYDAFIQKFDQNGNFLWARTFGSPKNVSGGAVTADNDGNIYVSGGFKDTVALSIDGETVYLMSHGTTSNYFNIKMSPTGDFIWARQSRGSGGLFGSNGKDMVVRDGFIYTVGRFSNDANFNEADPDEFLETFGESDMFIEKRDVNGNFIWIKALGGIDRDLANSLALDSEGNIWITRRFQETVDFDPGPGVFNLVAIDPTYDVFVQKLNSDGEFIWAGRIGDYDQDWGNGITIDDNDNVYVAGFFSEDPDFDMGPGIALMDSKGQYDVFILKLDNDGGYLWSKSFGGTWYDRGFDVAVDSLGNCYVSGHTSDGAWLYIDFDPGPETANEEVEDQEFFIEKLDSNGNYIWHQSYEFSHDEDFSEIIRSAGGNIYAIGTHLGGDFHAHNYYEYPLESNGNKDWFVLKLGECEVQYTTETVVACEEFEWIDDSTYTNSTDTAAYLMKTTLGCDSIVTLNLTLHQNDSLIN
jgi:hypothetical protein